MHDRFRPLGWAAYAVAFLLIVIPLVDSLLSVWPLRVADVSWRFGAVGLFSRAVMTPLLGLLAALVTAVMMEHRRVARTLAALAFMGSAAALAAIAMFALDALQTRVQVRPEALAAFNAATVVAMAKYVAGAVVGALLGVGGWKAAGKIGHPARARGRTTERPQVDSTGILIGSAPPRAP